MSSSSQPLGSDNSTTGAYAASNTTAAQGVGNAATGLVGVNEPKPQTYSDKISKSGQKYGNVDVNSFNSARPKLDAPETTSTAKTEAEALAEAEYAQYAAMQASLNYSRNLLGAAYRVADSIPSDTERVTFLNYLKAIGEALTQAQQQIYELQLAQTAASIAARKSEKESIEGQATVRAKETQDIRDQNAKLAEDQKKMQGLSSFMSTLGPWATAFSVALSLATLGGATPLMIAVNVVLIGLTIGDSALAPLGINVTAEVFGALTQVILKMDPNMDPKVAEIISTAIMTAVLIGASAGAAAKVAGSLGNAVVKGSTTALAATALVVARSPLIKDITYVIAYEIKMSTFSTPKDEKEAQAQKDEAKSTAELAGLIVGSATSIVLSIGAVTASTNQARVLEGFERLMNRLRTGFSLSSAGLQVTTLAVGVGRGYVQSDIYDIKAAIEGIKAAADAQEVATQDQIDALRKLSKLILDLLTSLSAGVNTINDLQIKKIKDVSEAVRF